MARQSEPSDGMQSKREQPAARPRAGWYRGVKLQRPARPPRMPLHQLKEAAEHAVRRNGSGAVHRLQEADLRP